eukprot:scaffold1659_cov255-Pinguiococcus_pyrenoidosus.AAC.23
MSSLAELRKDATKSILRAKRNSSKRDMLAAEQAERNSKEIMESDRAGGQVLTGPLWRAQRRGEGTAKEAQKPKSESREKTSAAKPSGQTPKTEDPRVADGDV